jgi:hypothetical protein
VIAMGVELTKFSLGGTSRIACGVAGLASACFRNGLAGCLRLPELKFCCTSHPKTAPSPDLSEKLCLSSQVVWEYYVYNKDTILRWPWD